MNDLSHHPAFHEGHLIVDEFNKGFPPHVEGRQAILEMKEGGSRNWRQMEWIGFYPEFWFEQNVSQKIGAGVGPRYGNVVFDIRRQHVWDLKAHSSDASPWAPLNDIEAVRGCIADHDGIGFIVISGACQYDEEGTFRAWHDALKGAKSNYTKQRERRGARPRRRKASFEPNRLVAFRLGSHDDLGRALREGWMGVFQEGMRNSNGAARRPKVKVNLGVIPAWALVADVQR
jgi:hypothetical protein